MTETESNEAFLKRVAFRFEHNVVLDNWDLAKDNARLLALARRGAAIPDEPTEAMKSVGGMLIFDGGVDLDDFGMEAADEVYRAMIQTALKEAKP
jgi:hypothetical protein